MHIPTPTGIAAWNAGLVRDAMPSAYTTASYNSEYSANPNYRTLNYCRTIYLTVKEIRQANETNN
jgi:hypothetical protein